MGSLAIQAEHLTKRYLLGTREPYGTLRDSLSKLWRVPFRKQAPKASDILWALNSYEPPRGTRRAAFRS